MTCCRKATLADQESIIALLNEIMTYHGIVAPNNDALADVIKKIFSSANHLLLVAESRGEVVGMCNLIFSYSTWLAAAQCEVQDLIVTSSHRGQGIGLRLLEAAAREASARGCARLFLLAESFNLPAHDFYRRLGLQEKTCLVFEQGLSPRDTSREPSL